MNSQLPVKQAFMQRCAAAGIEVAIERLPAAALELAQRRNAESALARTLARGLLLRHGLADARLERHADGFALWPAGWAGSLAHSGGWSVAALGWLKLKLKLKLASFKFFVKLKLEAWFEA